MTRIVLNKKQKLAVLKRARTILRRPGAWTKLRYATFTPKGQRCYCARGAVGQAMIDLGFDKGLGLVELAGRVPNSISLEKTARKQYLQKFGGRRGGGIIQLNDHPTTKKKDVLRLFDTKIAELEEELA